MHNGTPIINILLKDIVQGHFLIKHIMIKICRKICMTMTYWNFYSALTLKRKCHRFEIFVIGCTESCHFDNFRCSQWRKIRRRNNNISFHWCAIKRDIILIYSASPKLYTTLHSRHMSTKTSQTIHNLSICPTVCSGWKQRIPQCDFFFNFRVIWVKTLGGIAPKIWQTDGRTYMECLQSLWWRHQMESLFPVTGFCEGHSPVTGEFPTHWPVSRSLGVFFDLRLNQQLRKQWSRRWFWTPSHSLWRHCNVLASAKN